MKLINFGNPLNKIKKNNWFLEEGRKIDVPFTDGLKYTNAEDIKRAARSKIDDEIQIGNISAIDNSINKLNNITEKKIKNNPDYTDIRYDNDSQQYVGFPKVNGYMEVPIGLGNKELLNDDFTYTAAGNYVNKKGSIPNRQKDPRHTRGIDNLFDFTIENKYVYFGNPLNKIKKNEWLDSLAPGNWGERMRRHTAREGLDRDITTAREALTNKSRDRLDFITNLNQAKKHIPGTSAYLTLDNKFVKQPPPIRAVLQTPYDEDLNSYVTSAGKYIKNKENMIPKRK